MSTPEHVIVGGRKFAEMLSDTQLADHVIVGAAALYGRGHDWMVSGQRMVNVAEVANYAAQRAQGSLNGMEQFALASVQRVADSPFGHGIEGREYQPMQIKHHTNPNGMTNKENVAAFKEHLRQNWEHDYNAGLALGRAAGWAAAGQYDEALGETVEAAKELFQGWVENNLFFMGQK